ncbi:MAG: hypothetical protein RMJ36_05130 [Candidatus Calescibacterium sp.]|nr:hypothetical protein [Candidatus Calescibacterium sp.]MDW8133018.1 hypothetical protein [Candidatus Calescibacterium sp.]
MFVEGLSDKYLDIPFEAVDMVVEEVEDKEGDGIVVEYIDEGAALD